MKNKAMEDAQPHPELEEEINKLQAKVLQLEKINKVLRDRVKRGMDSQGDAFALFHAATALEQKVQERTAELEKANVELQGALIKEKELAKARDQAIDSSQLKSQFLANMSHEIRTPMNGVIGMTSLLMDTKLDEDQLDFVNIIRTSGESLLTVINDILDFSKIEAKKLVLERQPFDVRTCVEEALDLITSSASNKGLELLCYIEQDVPPIITSDITRLRQILVNLLSNAVKFTERGEVLVSVSASHLHDDVYRIEFAVKDSGIGIPDDRIKNLFDAFSQVDASTTRKYGGTGLGLAISYQLATLLGGGINVESELNRGSTFHLSIVAPASAQTTKFDFDVVKGKRILIVDDSSTNRKILSALTTSWEMIPVVVSSGTEVLSLINKGNVFDAALLDFQMPEMDGLTLAETLSHHAAASDLPLVMLSSIGERQTHSSDLFAHWLTKPVKQEQLHRVLSSIFGDSSPIKDDFSSLPVERKASNVRILLAEDNAINQKVAVHMLSRLGYRIDVVANGKEVLSTIAQIPYDIILMDVMMPEMDGIEATQLIRKDNSILQPCIIALTANAMEEDRERCLSAGMDDYISKPIKADMLKTVLERWVGRLCQV
ncbi:MAG: response regulator [Rhodothermales bacterium]